MSIPALDVAIGLSFVYLLLALICTTLNEVIAGWRKTRARYLDRGIDRLFGGDQELKKLFYAHPVIQSLARSDREVCPSYIPARRFVTAVMDIVSGPGAPSRSIDAIRARLGEVGTPAFRQEMALHLEKAGNTVEVLEDSLETWFSDNMDRVSGWYKRNAQRNAFLLAAIVTLTMNADTLRMVQVLWTNPTVRAAVVEEARARAQKDRPEDLLPVAEYDDPNNPNESKPVQVSDTYRLTSTERELLSNFTGWHSEQARWPEIRWWQWLLWVLQTHLVGWILTTIAVGQGAPFWFDTLNRFMNIRNAGRAPDERRDKTRN